MRYLKWLIVILVAVGLLFAAKGFLVKSVVRKVVSSTTGFDLALGGLDVGLFKQSFEVKGLKLRNPADFPDREAFDIDRLYVRYDLFSFFGPTTRLRQVVIEIPQLVMVKKEDGESNLERMKKNTSKDKPPAGEAERQKTEPPRPPPQEPAGGSRPPRSKGRQFMVDSITLDVGKVEIRDYQRKQGDQPRITTYELNYHRSFSHIGTLQAMVDEIVADVMIEGGVKALVEKLGSKENTGKLSADLDKAAKKFGSALNSLFKKRSAEKP